MDEADRALETLDASDLKDRESSIARDGPYSKATNPLAQKIWDQVSRSPVGNLWNFHGAGTKLVWTRTFRAMMSERLLSRAAEMGYYFLFALFPALICASSVLGLAARHASHIADELLRYLGLMIPGGAYSMVIQTFNETAAAATEKKITLGLVVALWSASTGFASIQDGMNAAYKVSESRPYWKARGSAILVTMLLMVLVTINLAVLLAGDAVARLAYVDIWHHHLARSVAIAIHVVQWIIAVALLLLQFSVTYYFAPDLKVKRWHWLTPGAAVAIFGWVVASLGLQFYLRYFNSFTRTYGSLGAVIVLLTWFYITALMLLLGGQVNGEIQAALVEKQLKAAGAIPAQAEAEPEVAPG